MHPLLPVACVLATFGDRQGVVHPLMVHTPISVILVMSGRTYSERRHAIRSTWAKDASNVYFMIGQPSCHIPPSYRRSPWACVRKDPSHRVPIQVQIAHDKLMVKELDELRVERERHRDIILLPMVDAYRDLALKLKLSYEWALKHTTARWLVKTDDDNYIRPHGLNRWLRKIPSSGYTMIAGSFSRGGSVDRSGKWRERGYKGHSTWPPYPSGATHIVSRNLVTYVANTKLTMYQGEDVSMAVWIKEAPFATTLLPEKERIITHNGNCMDTRALLVGHDITPARMRQCYQQDKRN